MWPVSQRFLDTIPHHHALATTVTATPPGEPATSLRLVAGTVTADRSQRIRRTGTLIVEGGTALYALLTTPGTRIAVDHGFQWSGIERELVPQIRGELSAASLRLGDGTIQATIADGWQRLAAADYPAPFSPLTTARRVDTVFTAITSAMPGITVHTLTRDTGPVGTVQVWTSRADLVTALATDGGAEVYFAPDGAFVIRDTPTATEPAVWTIKTGTGGTLTTMTRSRPLDRLHNTVILTPATLDTAQTWTQVTASITDTGNPRHPDRIGIRPYRYQAPTLLTETDAVRVAGQLLDRVQGSTETLTLEALANPALEPGDVIRALTPIDGGYDLTGHLIEQTSIDLTAGTMTCQTRSGTALP